MLLILAYAIAHDGQMLGNVALARCKLQGSQEAGLSLVQCTPLDLHHAQVVQRLNMVGLQGQDAFVALLCFVQILYVVDVDVTQQDESFNVVWVGLKKLLKVWNSIQWSV